MSEARPGETPGGDYFFVRRPIVAIVISILTVIAGLVTMSRLPIAQYPEIVPPLIQVTTTFTGADALTVEQAVATPIEQQMNGVDNMLYMKSINANDGSMTLQVSFEVGSDIDMDNVLAQNRVSQAMATLPQDVKTYGVTTKKSMPSPLLVFSVYSPNGTYDANFLANYATINVNDRLKRVTGVGDVRNFGAADYAMRIWVRPDKLASLGLTVPDLVDAIQQQNQVNPAGQVGGEPAPPGQELTYSVRAQGRLITAEEFGRIVVRADPGGAVVRLEDVARIDLGVQLYNQKGRYRGKPAAVIVTYQSPGSNALATAEGLKAAMDEAKASFPADLDYVVSLDTTLQVTEGIDEIVHTLLEAMVLVILVVYLFLQSWRATLIPLLTVPVSLIGAFMVFPALGFTINTLSLFGLVLAIGLVVDDAIVVVEAVQHHIEQGRSPRDATVLAMRDVSSPVIAIALILAAVFVPVAFVPGITGRMYQQFALTIAISVLISAINALTLSPALCSLLMRPAPPEGERTGLLARFFAAFNRGFERVTHGYVGFTGACVRKTARSLLFLLAVVAAAGLLGRSLPGGFVTEEDQGYVFAVGVLPNAASLQRTDAVARRIEAILAKTPGVRDYNTIVGFDFLTNVYSTYATMFFIQLEPWHERTTPETSAKGVVQAINRELARLPEAVSLAFGPPAISGVGSAGGFSMMLQDRAGLSLDELQAGVNLFLEAARKRPELTGISSSLRADVPQIYADVNRDKVETQGVDIKGVYQTLQAFMGSVYVNDFNRFGRQWKVYLQAEPEYRTKPSDVETFYVRNRQGTMLPLSSVVTTRSMLGPEATNRFNLFRTSQVTGSPAPGYTSGQAMAVLEEIAKATLPSTMGYAWADMSYQERRSGSVAPVFALSLLLVFLILAAQYESWSLPFSVLLAVPTAIFGAFLGLALRKFELNVYSSIGLVMLIGLAAKNAILIVEFAKVELEKGEGLVEAALSGARLRLRPILMTSFAFILGCVPLYVAAGAGSISRQQLGTVVVWGMLIATVLGIFLTPVLFTVVERLVHRDPPARASEAPPPGTAGRDA